MIEIRLILVTDQKLQVSFEGDCLARERIEMWLAIEYQWLLETLCDDTLSRRSRQRHQKLLSDRPCRGHRDDTVTDKGQRVVLSFVVLLFPIIFSDLLHLPILSISNSYVCFQAKVSRGWIESCHDQTASPPLWVNGKSIDECRHLLSFDLVAIASDILQLVAVRDG